jgi:hypothetical protein
MPENLVPRTSVSCLYRMFLVCFGFFLGPIDNIVHLWISILALVAFSCVLMISVNFIVLALSIMMIVTLSAHTVTEIFYFLGPNVLPLTSHSRKSRVFKAILPYLATCCSRQGYVAYGDIWKQKMQFEFFPDKAETEDRSKFQDLRAAYLWRHIPHY